MSGVRCIAVNRKLNEFSIEKQKEWSGPFTFIHAADTQFGIIESFDGKVENPGWEEDMRLARKAVSKINKLTPKPKFVVVSGDLVHAFPETETDVHEAQKKDFLEIFSKLDSEIPLVCVSGNHDLGQAPTKDTISRYVKTFGEDYFTFWCGGVFFLVLNTQFYEDNSKVCDLAQEHEKWLDQVLASIKDEGPKFVIVLQHIPWFLKDPDEVDDYFNITTEWRKKHLEKLYASGVNAVFCGHYHRNTGGWYKSMEVVTTSAVGLQLGDDVSGFRIVNIEDGGITHKYVDLN